MSMKKRATKSIALALVGVTVAIPVSNTVFAMESNTVSKQNMNIESTNTEKDSYAQGLIENIDIEGVNYTFEHYYNENGERSISITDMARSKSQILTYDEKTSNIYLDGEKIGDIKTVKDDGQALKNSKVDTSWKLINGPVHKYISWKKGTTTAIVAGAMATVLGFATNAVITAIGLSSLSILASNCIGGTLHYSKYYRNLAFGQTQYRTDWSFVASSGDRYGTYTYLSTPQ